MNWKSYFLGLLSGVVLTFVVMVAIGLSMQNTGESDPIQYMERPVSYEGKTQSSFKVLQVLGNAALANEASDDYMDIYLGNTVLILGENFYSDQIIKIQNPQRIGTYSYTTQGGMPKTVPVLSGQISE